jgi:hypothetical protein
MKKVWVPTPSLHTLLRVLGVDDEEKKRKKHPNLVHYKRGELSRLVSSPPSTEQLALVCTVQFHSSFPPPHTNQEAITTLQNNWVGMGAPIPTHNPLYIIYNFQQEVLFLHN